MSATLPEAERARIDHLIALLGGDLGELLEVGARDGRVTRALLPHARHIVALDLRAPAIDLDRVSPVAGDATALPFPDRSFDTVICTEVLEHIPGDGLQRACAELARVTRGRLLVTVPFEQDLAVGATRCGRCGTVNPPWGHVNRFTRDALLALFPTLSPVEVGTFGTHRNIQPPIAKWIEARLGYPHGAWQQEEPCIACGAPIERPRFSKRARALALIPRAITRAARAVATDRPSWIHAVLSPA